MTRLPVRMHSVTVSGSVYHLRHGMMEAYLKNTWFRIGLAIVVVGWGPLLAIILLAGIGLWPDPNPNPIGPGLLFMFTSWPATICLGIGVLQVNRRGPVGSSGVPRAAAPRTARMVRAQEHRWAGHPAVRVVAGVSGVFLIVYGVLGLLDGEGRGAAAAIVIGFAGGYWAVSGRLPSWFRR